MNILFICSRNKKRSRTAETIFRDQQEHNVSSAGTEANAVVRVTEKMIARADMIFVMEKVHRDKLRHQFGDMLGDKEIVVLNTDMMEPYW